MIVAPKVGEIWYSQYLGRYLITTAIHEVNNLPRRETIINFLLLPDRVDEGVYAVSYVDVVQGKYGWKKIA